MINIVIKMDFSTFSTERWKHMAINDHACKVDDKKFLCLSIVLHHAYFEDKILLSIIDLIIKLFAIHLYYLLSFIDFFNS